MNQPWHYIVLLGAFIIVCALVLPRRSKAEPAKPADLSNLEDSLELFMSSMEKDNRELVEMVAQTRQEWQADTAQREQRITRLEQANTELARTVASQRQEFDALTLRAAQAPRRSEPGTLHAAKQLAAATEDSTAGERLEEQGIAQETPDIRGRYASLFALHEQGKSIEYIARKSGMNKGEVQLILQLSRQEEQHRA
ncbi:hypothetical protein EBB07_32040 [Paenibacillaceae bacterium]|nr:hypothetical protein EBB07_32040 [Paenibacillaceae bacterium]